MDRPIIYSEEVPRSFDVLSGWKDSVVALGKLYADVAGSVSGMVAGLAATPTGPASLTINIGPGRVYQQSALDGTAYGSVASDARVIVQQGDAAAQTVTLSLADLTSGKSKWALIQAQFAPGDAVRSGDPTAGVLQFWNSANPTSPLEGQGNNGTPLPTVRLGGATISVIYGAVANTGAEVPPSASAGFIGLYLIDLAFGQTTIVSNQILVAGPSVGTGVPNNYPYAPFLAGLLNAHHGGTPGQAPKIDLTKEVQGVLPPANSSGFPVIAVAGAAATYGNAQIGSLISRSNGNTGAVMRDLLPGTAAGFPADGAVFAVRNSDTLAFLAITAQTGATINNTARVILGPGQTARFAFNLATNTYFPFDTPLLAKLAASMTVLYISASGDDTSNDGLSASSPFATRQKAWDTLQRNFDLNYFAATIQIANGAYVDEFTAGGGIVGAATSYPPVIFQGNNGSPSSVQFTTTGSAFLVQGCVVQISGCQLNSSQYGIRGIGAGTQVYYGNINFNANTLGDILLEVQASAVMVGPVSISTNKPFHMLAQRNAVVFYTSAPTITLIGTPAFSNAFVVASDNATVAMVSMTFTGSATGVRYVGASSAVIDTNAAGANYFPGNSPGTLTSGAQYV